MEEAWLRSQLEAGRSIAAIARELGKAPSTVAFWVGKHGLASAHTNPAAKAFGLASGGLTRSLEKARAGAAKCVLVCATGHAEIEAGLATIAQVRPGRLPVWPAELDTPFGGNSIGRMLGC